MRKIRLKAFFGDKEIGIGGEDNLPEQVLAVAYKQIEDRVELEAQLRDVTTRLDQHGL